VANCPGLASAPAAGRGGYAAVPEEQIWLASRKSSRTRQAYRHDVGHFVQTLGIRSADELRRVDHKAVLAWEAYMRETEHAEPSTVRRRLAALPQSLRVRSIAR